MRTTVILSAALLHMLAVPALAQQQRPQVSVSPDDVVLRYVAEGHMRLNDDPSKDARFFMLDVAYNLKLWHMGLTRTVTCNGLEYPVRALQVEGVHVYDGGAKATVYYGAEFEPQAGMRGKADEICKSGSLILPLERLSDNDWYVPAWGLRMVKRR
jgi:hypothetical protein